MIRFQAIRQRVRAASAFDSVASSLQQVHPLPPYFTSCLVLPVTHLLLQSFVVDVLPLEREPASIAAADSSASKPQSPLPFRARARDAWSIEPSIPLPDTPLRYPPSLATFFRTLPDSPYSATHFFQPILSDVPSLICSPSSRAYSQHGWDRLCQQRTRR